MKVDMPLSAYAAVAGVVLVVVAAWLGYAEFSEKVAEVEALSAQVDARPDNSELRAAVAAAQADAEEASRQAGRALRAAQAPAELPESVDPGELADLRGLLNAAVERVEALEDEVNGPLPVGGSRLDQLEKGSGELRQCIRALISVLQFLDSESSDYLPYTGPRC